MKAINEKIINYLQENNIEYKVDEYKTIHADLKMPDALSFLVWCNNNNVNTDNIKTTPREIITINYKSIDRRARKVERQNLKTHGQSLSFVSISSQVRVLHIRHGSEMVDVYNDWKEVIDKNILPTP